MTHMIGDKGREGGGALAEVVELRVCAGAVRNGRRVYSAQESVDRILARLRRRRVTCSASALCGCSKYKDITRRCAWRCLLLFVCAFLMRH